MSNKDIREAQEALYQRWVNGGCTREEYDAELLKLEGDKPRKVKAKKDAEYTDEEKQEQATLERYAKG